MPLRNRRLIQSSLIISNYSIRTDSILSDIGNFPAWDTDFFKRDSRLLDSFFRHAHILDFDSLRLGKKVLAYNPRKDSFEFGVVVITEVGKERGNSIENAEKKKKDVGANQKNDLFNSWLKMVRHSATVDNYPFVKVLTDEQRPESWGADARDLCDIVHMRESGLAFVPAAQSTRGGENFIQTKNIRARGNQNKSRTRGTIKNIHARPREGVQSKISTPARERGGTIKNNRARPHGGNQK